MRKIIFKALVFMMLLMPTVAFAEDSKFVSAEDENVYFYIFGDDAEKFQDNDFSITEITEDVKQDSELLEKINNYGTLIKAYNIDLSIEEDLTDYWTYFDFALDYDKSLLKNLAGLLLDGDKLLPTQVSEEYYYDPDYDADHIYYELTEFVHTGKIFIIDPLKTTYTIENPLTEIQFDYYKYKQYTSNDMLFGSINKMIENPETAKELAESKGLDYDKIIEANGNYDYGTFDIEYSKDEVNKQFKKISNGRTLLNVYGLFFVNRNYNRYESIEYFNTPIKIKVKIDDTLKDYDNLAVYLLDWNGKELITTGNFLEDYYYCIYNEETGEYEYIYDAAFGYLAGDTIPMDGSIVVETDEKEYSPINSGNFAFWDTYYIYNGEEYIEISDYDDGDPISEYGQTVYMYDYYKLPDNDTFQDNVTYIYCEDNSMNWFEVGDYRIGEPISNYTKRTGNQVYIEKMVLTLNEEDIKPENGYITFTYNADYNDSIYPYFFVAGAKNQTYTTATESKDFTLEFEERSGLKMTLTVDDFEKYSNDKVKETLNGSKLSATEIVEKIKKELIDNELINIYNITVKSNNNKEYTEGPFNIKIKINDKLSKYKDFKLVNIQTDSKGNIVRKDVITLKEENGYLVGEVPHLSVYALTGTPIGEKPNNIDNPKTYDNINSFILIDIASILGLIGCLKIVFKKRVNQ